MYKTMPAQTMRSFRLYSKFLSLAHDSVVEDDVYRAIYQIKGSTLSLGHRFKIYDAASREVGRLNREYVSLAASFSLDRPDAPLATIKRELLTPHRFQFTIDPGEGETLDVISRDGDRAYTVERGEGRLVASISRGGGGRAEDAYWVQVKADEDHLLILACVMALDLVCHDHDNDTELFGEQSRRLQDFAIVTINRMVYGISQWIRRVFGRGKGRK